MAYVYYIPPVPLPPVQERPSLCSPTRSTGFICGPALIFVGGTGALMIGFFERKPIIIWPIISFGALLCLLGVFLARRHVKHWREAEQERQRAMWRTNRGQPGDPRRSGGDGGGVAHRPEFDVPMYCLEAPSRSLPRHSDDRAAISSQYGTGGGGQPYEGDYWCALAVPLSPDNVNDGEYLNWAAMTLVVQPHFKYGATAPAPANGIASSPTGCGGAGGGAAACINPGILTRSMGRTTYSGFSGACDVVVGGGEACKEHASEPTLAAVSLTLVRSPSIGARSAHGSLHGGGVNSGSSERRVGRGSRTGRIGDLLSLFAAVAGNGGGDAPPEVDENGVELAGLKAMAAQAAVVAGQRQSMLPAPPPAAFAPQPATTLVSAAGPSGSGEGDQQRCPASPNSSADAAGVAPVSNGGQAEEKLEKAVGLSAPAGIEDARGEVFAAATCIVPSTTH